MNLPKIKDDNAPFQMMQDKWASILNPLLAQPLSSAGMLTGIKISTGTNVINTLLDRKMQGWFVSDIDAAVTLFRSAPFNDKTLTLTSSGPCNINLVVF